MSTMSGPTMPPTPDVAADLEMNTNRVMQGENIEMTPDQSPTITQTPTSTSKKRHMTADSKFSLPPPPSRPRRIIQMKPATQQREEPRPTLTPANSKGSSNGSVSGPSPSPNTGRKGPNPSTAAGKKMARKTAHSVIERRRRSKMNEEFSTLKSMIPACQGQEMHKLAILQASIDYLRYLERCVNDLKAANNSDPELQQPPGLKASPDDEGDLDDGDGQDSDIDMEEPSTSEASPVTAIPQSSTASYMSPHSLLTSPAMQPSNTSPSINSTNAHRRNPSLTQMSSTASDLPSPAFAARHFSQYSLSGASMSLPAATIFGSRSAETSPIILPGDADHDASAALLMLNRDRRGSKDSSKGKALSVKDLLSSQ